MSQPHSSIPQLEVQPSKRSPELRALDKALLSAACAGRASACSQLLQKGASPRAQATFLNQTALMLAARQGHSETVEALMAASDPLQLDQDRHTPLMLAVMSDGPGSLACVKALMKFGSERLEFCGARIDDPTGDRPLALAAALGRADMLEALLPMSLLNYRDSYGFSAIHRAANHGNAECLALLLAQPGIDTQGRTGNGETLLICAAGSNNGDASLACAKMLLPLSELGARDRQNLDALCHACMDESLRMTRLLLAAPGADQLDLSPTLAFCARENFGAHATLISGELARREALSLAQSVPAEANAVRAPKPRV